MESMKVRLWTSVKNTKTVCKLFIENDLIKMEEIEVDFVDEIK